MRVAGYVTRSAKLGVGYRIAVALLKPLLIMFTKRDWRGFEQLESVPGGMIVATNHTSWFDPLPVAHALYAHDRPPRFLVKESVFRVPVVGWVVSHAGQIRVYRESAEATAAFRDAVVAVEHGECVIVYPEGTITKDPELWPMQGKTGAVRIALASGKPLFPMLQWGPHEVMSPYKMELRLLPRKTMHVWLGKPIDLTSFQNRELTPQLLHAATDKLMQTLAHMEGQIRGVTPPSHLFSPTKIDPDSAENPITGGDT